VTKGQIFGEDDLFFTNGRQYSAKVASETATVFRITRKVNLNILKLPVRSLLILIEFILIFLKI